MRPQQQQHEQFQLLQLLQRLQLLEEQQQQQQEPLVISFGLSKSTEFEQGPFVSCLSHNTSSLQHATPPHHTATSTTQQPHHHGTWFRGRKGDVAPRWPHYLHTTTTSATTHQNQSTPPPAGGSTTARSTCRKTSQIELCCRTSGDFFWAVQKHGIRTRSLRFLSFTQQSFSPPHHTATSTTQQPHHHHGMWLVLCMLE